MRKKTNLFLSGNGQAVRIPPKFQLEGNKVEIQRHEDTLVIHLQKQMWQSFNDSLAMFTDDFMEERRKQPPLKMRKRSFT